MLIVENSTTQEDMGLEAKPSSLTFGHVLAGLAMLSLASWVALWFAARLLFGLFA